MSKALCRLSFSECMNYLMLCHRKDKLVLNYKWLQGRAGGQTFIALITNQVSSIDRT